MTTSQGEPTLLRCDSMLHPAEQVEHILIAEIDVGEIHGQVPHSGVQHHAELGPQSLGAVVIEVTLQGYAGVAGATPPNGDRLLDGVFHVCSLGTTRVGVPPGSGAA